MVAHSGGLITECIAVFRITVPMGLRAKGYFFCIKSPSKLLQAIIVCRANCTGALGEDSKASRGLDEVKRAKKLSGR